MHYKRYIYYITWNNSFHSELVSVFTVSLQILKIKWDWFFNLLHAAENTFKSQVHNGKCSVQK